jgi:hypothetical protein
VLDANRWPGGPFVRYQNVPFVHALRRAGVAIWTAPSARVEHPYPHGRQFLRTGLSDGHDAAMRVTRGARSSARPPRRRCSPCA